MGRVGPTAYTTALKFLEIMADERLSVETTRIHASTRRAQRGADPTPAGPRSALSRLWRLGSKLVMQALNARRATAEEITEIRKLIEAEGGSRWSGLTPCPDSP